jgi:hypothetical protein
MKKSVSILNSDPDCMVRLVHYCDDVCAYMLEHWRKGLFRRKDLKVFWFNTPGQAEAYARKMIKGCKEKTRGEHRG